MANELFGNGGNDTLDGVFGADTLAGGAGDDVYIVDSTRVKVLEQAGEGTDRVISSVSTTLDEPLYLCTVPREGHAPP